VLLPPSPLELLIVCAAVWRVSALLTRERGPFDLFLKLRGWAGISADDEGRPLTWNESNFWASLFSCAWCASVWLGTLATIGLWLAPSETVWLSMPLAISAAAILMDRLMTS
jgi:hypothetical protein